ncbi:hypothetical protein HMPREF9606_00330 [Cutibacterium acnes HL036PA3]|nr:hypothetical protein HMPREF9593_02522 [Cutibacterium acnes HL046PA2]EFS90602.1 hypothetical protein HMPREF9606_00330 [Cutibacterium acnes HL036PA3]EFT53918.1 hypothetical protein HMPREF9569_00401 [Cutibacterium acnes HL078PA1]
MLSARQETHAGFLLLWRTQPDIFVVEGGRRCKRCVLTSSVW